MVRGEEIAQATENLSSLDIWEKSWKGVCRSTIRYNSSCTPFKYFSNKSTWLVSLNHMFLVLQLSFDFLCYVNSW